ncbi:MAG: hypothetical protein M5U01_13500 [Ardenticatenaceae bacterium]|nr:hypothetical protein [Ardenticatenaceae bacterium]
MLLFVGAALGAAFAPGLALVAWLAPGEWPRSLRVALAPGLSLALVALLVLLADLLHLRLGPATAWGLLVASGLALGVRARRGRPAALRLVEGLFLLAFLVVLLTRLWPIVHLGLRYPLWGDSLHHTMIVALMRSHGGLFDSWAPFAPLTSMTYHFGFHAWVVWSGWLLGPIEPGAPLAVLWSAQVLNALAALALAPLAWRLTARAPGDRAGAVAGVVALLVAGLWAFTPAFYANWGRDTQLAGQVILPGAMLLTLEVGQRRRRGPAVLLALLIAGLALTHYRILLLWVLWIPVVGLWALARRQHAGAVATGLAVPTAAGLFLAAPWLLNTLAGQLPQTAGLLLATRQPNAALAAYNALPPLTAYIEWPWLLLAGLALLLAVILRRVRPLLVALWWGLVVLLANPQWLRLPGTGIVNNFAWVIAAYIPVALLLGWLAAQAWTVRSPAAGHRTARPALAAGIVIVSLAGASARVNTINPVYSFIEPADEAAFAWIRANTPPDALFLVNGFLAVGESQVAGSDAGWWLPVTTGRRVTVPPSVYLSERGEAPDYAERTLALGHQVYTGSDLTDAATIAALRAAGVTHLYLGARNGLVGVPPGQHGFQAAPLQSSPAWELLYQANGAWVFALRPPLASAP